MTSPEQTPSCPECGASRVAPIVYGKPALEAKQLERLLGPDIEFAGSTLPENAPGWICRACGERFGTNPRHDLVPVDYRQIIENGRRLSALYASYAPTGRTQRQNWEVFSMACLARAHYTLTTVLDLEHRPIDCIPLARSVFEHVVAFAWIAIDPAAHYPRFLQWELKTRKKMISDLERFGALAPDVNSAKRALMDARGIEAPETADRALEADKHWTRATSDWKFGFRRTYANFFRLTSASVHPTVMGVEPFISRDQAGPRIGLPETDVWPEVAASTVHSFSDGLVVASLRLAWPPLKEIVFAHTHGMV